MCCPKSVSFSLCLSLTHTHTHTHIYVGGTQKFPELLKKKFFFKYLCKFETSVPFEVLPMRLDAAIPVPLPMEMLSRAASRLLAALDSISVEDFRRFQHWERCWDCCIQSQRDYFEGDQSFKLVQIRLNFFLTIHRHV